MRLIAIAALALVTAGCAQQQQSSSSAPSQTAAAKATAMDPYANGRSIFTTGRDLTGHAMSASPAPYRSSCKACHNADGSGGVHLPGGAVSADLRHGALVTGQHPPYTVTLIERAISTGVDNQGEKLNPVMPRWRMSKGDLRDVALYVYNRLR